MTPPIAKSKRAAKGSGPGKSTKANKVKKEVELVVTTGEACEAGNTEFAPETPSTTLKSNKRGAKGSGSGAKGAKIVKEVEPILTPKDATNVEKNLLWLWAYYKTSSDASPSHVMISKCLDITSSVSKHRFNAVKLSIEGIQKRAEEKILEEVGNEEQGRDEVQEKHGSQGDKRGKGGKDIEYEADVEDSAHQIEA
ncbi:hypothetical protein N7495_006547 [Penicillium taxi]|uniref:uncharacterized protein n=1 Tax=Penicillium taxi TaxID=168475 RepID=UPI002545789C|nr:uncharacterized protein N7495_006547 [Penicillium taxi]KAJ5894856.1 hypothetical protein N7495_006547 [Penicillium taxi]